ncbi:alpha/beta hydrolase [Geminicoccaceae bacterium 1502E]|nr:alpha/beta hydrolase [Geminicoccaceae bacterium 1502E]
MLFITNRRLLEGTRSRVGRSVRFDLADNQPGPSLFFCRRIGPEAYEELTAPVFLGRLRRSGRQQVLVYVHGFNCLPEPKVFPDAQRLQDLCDLLAPGMVEVVPLVWPCDDDLGLLVDYWDDQDAAEFSGLGFARGIGKFLDWRDRAAPEEQCLKHMNLLAHSMGNLVLHTALAKWGRDHGGLHGTFRNIFMMAADLPNDCLEPGRGGEELAAAARSVVVYHANDDFALRSSKIVNLRNKIVSRRLGHTGPRDPARVPRNVVVIDCDSVNSEYDRLGHSYFLADRQGAPGVVLQHLVASMRAGHPPAALASPAGALAAAAGNDDRPPLARPA